ncbi:hypothetical protein [Sulfolobus ellipsoid virus 1]|uniref:Uncharacterized protein n=1 Tax=Sulfolobus ellipsoid virus 1 TaxID=2056194 RepID=A0A2H4RBQ3_9VIRU|nr:hypothetical protein FGG62_gp19 [Sulfolobus ellipsoid virus 1]ATY46497.1 hypothetical protein [Sulfolobus ellipsoid virus 1]
MPKANRYAGLLTISLKKLLIELPIFDRLTLIKIRLISRVIKFHSKNNLCERI